MNRQQQQQQQPPSYCCELQPPTVVQVPVYQVQYGVSQQHNIVVATPVVMHQAQACGRFAPLLECQSAKRCGNLLITLGCFMLVGQVLETAAIGSIYPIVSGSEYSLISYVGFWGGVIVSLIMSNFRSSICTEHSSFISLYDCTKSLRVILVGNAELLHSASWLRLHAWWRHLYRSSDPYNL